MRLHSVAAWRFSTLVLALVIVGCATTSSPQEEVVTTGQPAAVVTTPAGAVAVTLPTELATIHPAYISAWRGTDPNAFEIYFTPTATVVTPSKTYTGWHDIHMGFVTPMLTPTTAYTITPVSFLKEGTDVIVETGNVKYKITEAGTLKDVTGTYTYKWMKQPDGTWRLMSVEIK